MKLVYDITTEERNYNHVTGKAHFQDVRRNWNDNSRIVTAFVWDSEIGQWVKVAAGRNW